jgi:REP element-mobilizing transposase RayT
LDEQFIQYDPAKHHRHSIRLDGYDYSQAGAYFVSIVTQMRENFFGEIMQNEMILNDTGLMVRAEWENLPNRFTEIELGLFQIMPNHFHGIVLISKIDDDINGQAQDLPLPMVRNHPLTLGDVVGVFKSITTIEYIKGVDKFGWQPFNKKLWQRNYYEHIIRNQTEYEKIINYINSNVINWTTDEENPDRNRIS